MELLKFEYGGYWNWEEWDYHFHALREDLYEGTSFELRFIEDAIWINWPLWGLVVNPERAHWN